MRTPEVDPPVEAATWAAVVRAVLDARATPATDRFDAELDRARAEGRIDADTARALRWWHRASVREVEDHVVESLPGTVAAVTRARAEASADAVRTAQAWEATRPSDPAADVRPEHGDRGGAPAGRSLVVGLTVLPDDKRDDAGMH